MIFLNNTATEILTLMDGRRTLQDIVDELAERYSASYDEISRDVLDFVSSSLREGFVSKRKSESVPVDRLKEDRPPSQGYLRFPVDVDLEVTLKCNMQCIHCYSNASALGGAGPSLEMIDRLACELGENRAFRVLLGGGEPLMNEDIVDIVKRFSREGLSVHISTNGLLFEEELAKELHEAGLRVVQFSLDGIGKTHEIIRGEDGAFDRVIEAIRLAKEIGFTVLVKTIVMKINLQEIPEIYRLVSRLGVDFYSFNRAVPSGRAIPNWSRVYVPYSEYESMLRNMKREMRRGRIEVGFEERVLPRSVALPPTETPSMCNAGISYISLDSEFHVRPCGYFPSDFSCGKLYEKWEAIREAWHNCVLLNGLRNMRLSVLDEPCRSCRRCYGGCRAAALLHFSRITAPDPQCPIVERRGSLVGS